jgi:transcriptional regulator of arginine metabolism
MANAAAAAIDAMKIETIVGTLAGDDTILVIMRTNDEAENLCTLVADLLS